LIYDRQAAMETLILLATLGGLTMGPKDPQQKNPPA
jgi:hypothetical protein